MRARVLLLATAAAAFLPSHLGVPDPIDDGPAIIEPTAIEPTAIEANPMFMDEEAVLAAQNFPLTRPLIPRKHSSYGQGVEKPELLSDEFCFMGFSSVVRTGWGRSSS